MIGAGTFERYAAALDANADLLESAVGELEGELSGVPAASLPDALAARYASLVMTYGAGAAAVAVDFYASLRELSGAESGYEPSQADAQDAALLLWDARSILETAGGDLSRALPSLSGRAVQRAMERADSTLVDNAARDPAHPKWALVPHAGACGWCVMIASNGFMYHTRAKAAKARHANCRCRPVVDFDTENPALEGYSPKTMRSAYRDCRAAVEDDAKAKWAAMSPEERARYGSKRRGAYDHYLRNRISAEMSTRDRAWLQTRRARKLDYSLNPMSSYGTLAAPGSWDRSNIVSRGNEWRDLWVHHVLEESGIAAQARGASEIDLVISGRWWEVKSPDEPKDAPKAGRELSFVESNVRSAVRQFKSRGMADEARMILNIKYRECDAFAVESELRRQMELHRMKESLLILSTGEMKRLTK